MKAKMITPEYGIVREESEARRVTSMFGPPARAMRFSMVSKIPDQMCARTLTMRTDRVTQINPG